MLLRNLVNSLIISGALASLPHVCLADDELDIAKSQLVRYEASLKNTAAKIRTIDGRIKSYDTKLADAQTQLDSSKAALVEARSELIQAQHDKSEDASRKLELVQKKYDLLERAAENREKRLARITRKLEDLNAEKVQLQASSKTIQESIASQARQVLTLSTAAKKREPKKAVVKSTPVRPKPKPTTEPAPELQIVEEVNTASTTPKAAQPQKVTQKEQTAPEKSTENKAKQNGETQPTAQLNYAQTQMEILSNKIQNGDDSKEWKRYKDLSLSVNGDDDIEFEFLGNYQYYAETELKPGKSALKIGTQKYSIKPKEKGIYVIIFDTTEMKKPKLIMFNKKHLD